MESAYDNLKIHTLEDMENMISIIKASKKTSKKWLIFTDSIGRGKVILSILVYTLFSRMFDLMQPPAVKHSIAVV